MSSPSPGSKLIQIVRSLERRRNYLIKYVTDRPDVTWPNSELKAINFALQFIQENSDLATELLRTKDEQRKKILNQE